jgi:hypothetical protein
MMEPPEAASIKSMCNIAGILALLAGILMLIGGIIWIILAGIFGAFIAIFFVIAGLFWIFFYMACKGIIEMVNARQYEQAKSKTMLWMIIGFIFGFWLGLILLIAYLKFDSLINAARAQAYATATGLRRSATTAEALPRLRPADTAELQQLPPLRKGCRTGPTATAGWVQDVPGLRPADTGRLQCLPALRQAHTVIKWYKCRGICPCNTLIVFSFFRV